MGKIAVLFSGQGDQYVGMFRDFFEKENTFSAFVDDASKQLNINLKELILEGPGSLLNLTENTQPAMLCCEVAIWYLLNNKIKPDYFAGFSLGEWSALVSAGVISAETAIDLVRKRARYMQEAVPAGEGAMAVVLGQDIERVYGVCHEIGDVYVSNDNCPGQITVAGNSQAIEKFLDYAEKNSIMSKKLAISVPSHCILMYNASKKLEKELQLVEFMNAKVPIIMNYTGEEEKDGEKIKNNMVEQLTSTVLFRDTISFLLNAGVDTFIEIGPGKTLAGIVKRNAKSWDKKVRIYNCNSYENYQKIAEGACEWNQ